MKNRSVMIRNNFTDERNRKDLKNDIKDIKKLIKKINWFKTDRIMM